MFVRVCAKGSLRKVAHTKHCFKHSPFSNCIIHESHDFILYLFLVITCLLPLSSLPWCILNKLFFLVVSVF